VPRRIQGFFNPEWVVSEAFDLHASLHIPGATNLFVGWSSLSLHSLSRAKGLGAKSILERNSSHMLHQLDILLEEYGRLGLKAQVPHLKIVEKQMVEYADADYISIPSQYMKRTFLERGFPQTRSSMYRTE